MKKQFTTDITSQISTTCPTCGKITNFFPQNPFDPFCSKRCQLIDFDEWTKEKKCISGRI